MFYIMYIVSLCIKCSYRVFQIKVETLKIDSYSFYPFDLDFYDLDHSAETRSIILSMH